MRFIKNSKKNNSASAGFTLVELAIVLSIILFFIGMIVSTGQARIEAQRINLTKERMRLIMNSIMQYARTLNHLPCPGGANLSIDDAAYGVGEGTGDNPVTTPCNITGNGNILTSTIVIGMVPVQTLVLPGDVALDGWGNRFTYVVDQDLTFAGEAFGTTAPGGPIGYLNNGDPSASPPVPPHQYASPTVGNIIIRNRSGGANFKDEVAVLIISHGPNGFGAWKEKGGAQIAAGGNADENENINDGVGGVTDNNIFVQTFRRDDFDDFLLYKTKGQLLEQ